DFSGHIAASRATRYLCNQLKDCFRCTEIRQIQTTVTVQDANKSYRRKVQAFGNHLRTDQYIRFSCAESAKELLMASFVLCCVCIHAQRADIWQYCMQGLFNLLGADSTEFHWIGMLTAWTVPWRCHCEPAQMAGHHIVPLMKCERCL